MSLRFVKSTLVAAIVSSSFAAAAANSDVHRDSRYWLHPKLGMVKVPRSTPPAPKADAPDSAAATTPAAARPDADACKPSVWLAPKGGVRRVVPKGCEP